MKYYLATKLKLSYVATQMHYIIMLSEMIQIQKDEYIIISVICGISDI